MKAHVAEALAKQNGFSKSQLVFSNLSMDDPLNERIALIPCFRYLDSLT
jgi:hypothetical protein